MYDPQSFTTEDAMAMATIDAARALGWDDEIGSREPGKAAVVVVVDINNTRLSPAYEPPSALVRSASFSDVESVAVAGRVVVDGGRVLTLDEPAVIEEARALGAKLGEALVHRRYRPLRHAPAQVT